MRRLPSTNLDDLHTMNTDAGRVLVPLARAAIGRELGHHLPSAADAAWLRAPGATFVTLTADDQLRGCIGTLDAHRPLAEDVTANAVAAAFRDPRFKPLQRDEFAAIAVEVSLLSAMEMLRFDDEAGALAQLRPQIDGIVLQYGHHRSTFLPQVWEQLPEPAEFLAHLKRKAGLPMDFWAEQVRLSRYTVSKWKENEEALRHEHS